MTGSWTRRLWLLGVTLLLGVGLFVWISGIHLVRGERFEVERDGAVLRGMLATPRWESGPFPAVVVVHGSGRVRWKDLRPYARRLVERGMAVAMYDKRGVGTSTGTFDSSIRVADSDEALNLLAADVSAAVDWLTTREDIDSQRLGLIGGSQAGWIMPLAATRNTDVDFIVAIAGPACTYGEEIYYSRLTGDDPGPYEDLSDAEIATRLAAFDGPHGYDPGSVLAQLKIPSLWILGGADRSVPTPLTIARLEEVAAAGRATFTIELFDDGDHSIRSASTGKTIDYWPRIYEWLGENDYIARGERSSGSKLVFGRQDSSPHYVLAGQNSKSEWHHPAGLGPQDSPRRCRIWDRSVAHPRRAHRSSLP